MLNINYEALSDDLNLAKADVALLLSAERDPIKGWVPLSGVYRHHRSSIEETEDNFLMGFLYVALNSSIKFIHLFIEFILNRWPKKLWPTGQHKFLKNLLIFLLLSDYSVKMSSYWSWLVQFQKSKIRAEILKHPNGDAWLRILDS